MTIQATRRPQLLLVGTGHWSNPGRDIVNSIYDDRLSSRRQIEIAEVLHKLQTFAPTVIAVEFPANQQQTLTERYQRFRAGHLELTEREQDQLGLRLAADCDLQDIAAIDWNEGSGDLGAVLAYAKEHQPELFADHARSSREYLDDTGAIANRTVGDILLRENSAESLAVMHQPYMTIAQVGHGNRYLGVEWVKGWYERNLMIFVNLTRQVTSPNDRLLVIYGLGHVPLLTQFAHESGQFSLTSLADVIGSEKPSH